MKRPLLKTMAFVLTLLCAGSFTPASRAAPTLLIQQSNPYLSYGYGLSFWVNMTAALDAAFGAANITVWTGSLNSVPSLSSYTALWITTRDIGESLTAAEQAALSSYIADGHRVALIGENNLWTAWNNSILAPVGGSYSGVDTNSPLTPVVINALTAGVTSLQTASDGIAVGGTSLFNQNVATLWGAGNVVSLLSVTVIDHETGLAPSNLQFETNLANFLASGGAVVSVPEPSSLTLLSPALLTGVAYLVRRRVKRAATA